MSNRTIVAGVAMAVVVAIASPAKASLQFNQNVTPGVIFGSGNANGEFTTDRANGLELGLRGKLRHNAVGAPENTFNSNGDGTYTFQAGVAPTQSFPTAEWSYEWSINSNYDGNGANLDAYTYEMGLDIDPGPGTNFITFDPINVPYWDHSIGDNSTTSATDFVAADDAEYASLISNYNVAQNSWKAHWYMTPFNPNAAGRYDLYISASNGNGEQARVEAAILVVPEPASLALLGLGGLALLRRRR